jgi:hypothetical protein
MPIPPVELGAYVVDPLDHGERRERRQQVHDIGQRPAAREGQRDRDEHDPLGPPHQPDGAAEAEGLRLGARVADEERADQGDEDARERRLVPLLREHEGDRAEHEALRDAVGGRVEEAAELRQLAVRSRERAVEDVEDAARDERDRRPDEVLLVDQDGRDRVEREARDRHLVGREGKRAEPRHQRHPEASAPVRVTGLDPGEHRAHRTDYTTEAILR